MQSIVRGQKLKLNDILDVQQLFYIQLRLDAPTLECDIASFGLDANYRLSDEAYMTFYNQPQTPCAAVTLQALNQQQTFAVQLAKLNPKIKNIVLTVAIDGQGVMSQLNKGVLQVLNSQKETVAEFAFDGGLFNQERAIMLLELYQKDGIWRMAAVAQGFNAGLDALIRHFGGEVAQDIPPTQTSGVNPTPPIVPPPIPNAPVTKVQLSKISLDKAGASHRINLNKQDNKTLLIEAIWIDNGDKNANNDDLDLRVGILLYGKKDMEYIHAPKNMGSLDSFPYVRHMGDVRAASKNQPGVEKVEVNADIANKLGAKVALVFSVYSAVSNGAVSIASLQPKMRMQYGEQIVECVFNPSVSPKAKSQFVYTYVIGIAIIDQQGIVLQHSGETSGRFSEKTPRLIWQGDEVSVKIDGKPMFKDS
jgi:tellurite resistance protein TerA